MNSFITIILIIICFFSAACSGKHTSGNERVPADSASFYLQKSRLLPDSMAHEAFSYAGKALVMAAKEYPGDKTMFDIYDQLGITSEKTGNYDLALSYFHQALAHSLETDADKKAGVYNYIGNISFKQGKYDAAMEYFPMALHIRQEQKNEEGIALSLLNIGSVYQKEEKYEMAEEQYRLSLNIYTEQEIEQGQANCFNNLGSLSLERNKPEEALDYYRKGAAIYDKNEQYELLAATLNNIGTTCHYMNREEEARNHYKQALDILSAHPAAKQTIAETYCIIGQFYDETNHTDSALMYYGKAVEMGFESGLYDMLQTALKERSRLYAFEQRYREAYNDHVSYKHIYDRLNNMETVQNFTQQSMQYEFDILQQEQQYKSRMQQLVIIALSFGGLFVCLLVVILYRNFIRKKKANILLTQQQKEIKDSMEYAGLIQKATLPPIDSIGQMLRQEYFIFFRPRDIVSGDFYWITQKGRYTVVAAADCTGHGVPGAIVSMLGISSLNKIVDRMEVLHADAILNELRDEIIRLLNPENRERRTRDGMDMSLIVIEEQTNRLQFAGAYNPLYLIHGNELVEVKGNRMPVGLHDGIREPFTASQVDYSPGDMVYLFSDGYTDQFGGQSNEKFKPKRFRALLSSIAGKPLDEQAEILENNYLEWKSDNPQTDDIIIIGIKL